MIHLASRLCIHTYYGVETVDHFERVLLHILAAVLLSPRGHSKESHNPMSVARFRKILLMSFRSSSH